MRRDAACVPNRARITSTGDAGDMKISQEDATLITNLYLSKWYGARRLLSEFHENGWKLGSIDSLHIVLRQPGSGRPRSASTVGGL